MNDLMEPKKGEGTGKNTGKKPTTGIVSEDEIDFDGENGPRARWCKRWYDVDILAKDVDENKLKALEFTKEGKPLTTNEQESLKKAAKLRDQNLKNQNLRRDAKVLQQMSELKSSGKLNKITRNEELASQTRDKSILKDTKMAKKTKAESKRKTPVVSMEIATLNDDEISKTDGGSMETRTRAGKLKFKENAEKKPTVEAKNSADKRTAKVKITKFRANNPSDEKEEHVGDDVLKVNDNKVHTDDNEETKGSGVDEKTEIREDSNTQNEAIGDAEKARRDNQPVLAAYYEKEDGNLKNRVITAKEMDESKINKSCKSNKLIEDRPEDSRKDISREEKKRITSIDNPSGHPGQGTSGGGKMREKSEENLLGDREDIRRRKTQTKSTENPCEDTGDCTPKERRKQKSSKGPGSESSPEDEPKMVELQKGSGIFVDYLEFTDIKAFAKFPGRMACALLRLCLGNQLIEMNAKRGNKIPDNIYKAVYRTCCKKFGKRRQSKAEYRKTVADLCNKIRKRYRESKLKEADEGETTDEESVRDGDISADADSAGNFRDNNDEGKIEKTTGHDEDTESYEGIKIDVTKEKAAEGVEEDQKPDEVRKLCDKGQSSNGAGENLVPITSNSEGMGRVGAHDTKEENPSKCQRKKSNRNETDDLVVADEKQLQTDLGSRSNLGDEHKEEVEKQVNEIKDREMSHERKIKYDRYRGRDRERRRTHGDERFDRKRIDDKDREKPRRVRPEEKKDKDEDERRRHAHKHGHESCERKRKDDRDKEKSRSERTKEKGDKDGNERQRRAHRHRDESDERKRRDDRDREKSRSRRSRERGANYGNEKREWAERKKSCNRDGIDQMHNYDKWRRNDEDEKKAQRKSQAQIEKKQKHEDEAQRKEDKERNRQVRNERRNQEKRYTKRKRDESCFENKKDRDRDIRYRRNLDEDGIKSKKYLKKHSENEHQNKSHEKNRD